MIDRNVELKDDAAIPAGAICSLYTFDIDTKKLVPVSKDDD